MTRGTILIVDDEKDIQELIELALTRENFHVQKASTVDEALKSLQKKVPDLVILDRILPDGDGIEVCNYIHTSSDKAVVPVLFLSQKSDVADRIASLKVGGDDYLPKPFDPAELIARVEALLRRANPEPASTKSIIETGPIKLDLKKHACFIDGQQVTLRRKEFELLALFLQNDQRVLTKDFLSERVWDTPYLTSSRAIDTAIQRLRQNIGKCADAIETVRGYGFKFDSSKCK